MVKASEQEFAMPQRSYSYGRISTGGKQARGGGLRRQQGRLGETDESWPERVCREHGWTLDEERFTDKGKSGFHRRNLGPKAALTKILKLIKSGRISKGSVLLVDKLDRLSRAEAEHALRLFLSILEAGVSICTKFPAEIFSADKPLNYDAMKRVINMMELNYLESAKKQENALEAWKITRHEARANKRPHNTKPPCWLKRQGDGYAVIPEIYDLCHCLRRLLLIDGVNEVAAKMLAEGEKWPGRSGTWEGGKLYHLITSRTFLGEYQPMKRLEDGNRVPDGDPIPGYYPAVFTEEQRNEMLAAMKSRLHKRGRPSKERTNVLVGLVYDADSQQRLNMQTSTSAGKLLPYLSRGQIAGTVRVRYDQLEALVLDTLGMLKPADVLDKPEEADERDKRIDELTARSTALQLREEQLRAKAADPDADMETALAAASVAKEERMKVIRELDALKLERCNGRVEALSETRTLREHRNAAEGEERNELDRRIQAALPSVVSEIWLQAQRIPLRKQIVHVQIYLRNGTCRDVMLLPDHLPSGVRIWQLDGWDLRRGPFQPGVPVSDAASMAASA